MSVLNTRAAELGLLLDEDHAPGCSAAARHRLHEPHVAPLTELVEDIRRRTGEEVPDVDPASPGVHARVLLMLQDPFCGAVNGARLVSRYSNDRTAGYTLRACEAAGLPDEEVLLWNVVPWWVNNPDRLPPGRRSRSRSVEARRAEPYLRRFLALLARLDTVVLLGREAQREWDSATPAGTASLTVLRCPHPGPMSYHAPAADGRRNREHIHDALRTAARGAVGPGVAGQV